MKQTLINKVLFGSCWSIMLWFLLIGIVLGFLVMGLVAIGILPKEFYGLSNVIASITGASMGSLLLFMIPLSIVWNKSRDARMILIVLSVIMSILNGFLQEFTGLSMLMLVVFIVISCTIKKENAKK